MGASRFFLLAGLSAIASACGSPGSAIPYPPDASHYMSLPTCSDPAHFVDGTARFDTTNGPDGYVDITCTPWRGPQVVLEYDVPGTGRQVVHVEFDPAIMPPRFAGWIAIRRGSCDARSTEYCIANDEQGDIEAQGGEHLYIIAGGHMPIGTDDRGDIALNIGVRDLSHGAPRITRATVVYIASGVGAHRVLVEVDGHDDEADAVGGIVTFYGPSGASIGDPGIHQEMFTATASGETDFTRSLVEYQTTLIEGDPALYEARVALYDAQGNVGDPIAVHVQPAQIVGRGTACDATHICTYELACMAGTCAVDPAVAMACAMAPTVTIPAPTTTTQVVRREVMLSSTDPDNFVGQCENPGDREPVPETVLLVPVTVPNVDLIVEMDVDASTFEFYLMWLRRSCDVALSTMDYCVDTFMSDPVVEIDDAAMGTYAFFTGLLYVPDTAELLDIFLDFKLRPVLDDGQPCDVMQVDNRCRSRNCDSLSGMCAPGI